MLSTLNVLRPWEWRKLCLGRRRPLDPSPWFAPQPFISTSQLPSGTRCASAGVPRSRRHESGPAQKLTPRHAASRVQRERQPHRPRRSKSAAVTALNELRLTRTPSVNLNVVRYGPTKAKNAETPVAHNACDTSRSSRSVAKLTKFYWGPSPFQSPRVLTVSSIFDMFQNEV